MAFSWIIYIFVQKADLLIFLSELHKWDFSYFYAVIVIFWISFPLLFFEIHYVVLCEKSLFVERIIKMQCVIKQLLNSDIPISRITKVSVSINNLLTESEGSTGKYPTEVLLYWPSESEVNTARPRLDIFPYCPNGWGQ
jgi:hypothetical protein